MIYINLTAVSTLDVVSLKTYLPQILPSNIHITKVIERYINLVDDVKNLKLG